MKRIYYVTPLAGAYVAGRRVELMRPGPSGAIELDLFETEAAAELRIGSLSEEPPGNPAPNREARPHGAISPPGRTRRRRAR